MACQKPKTTLSNEEVKLYLKTLNKEKLAINDIANEVKHPIFKVKASLRELTKVGYVEQNEEGYQLSALGKITYSTL